jgi:hypothetical protein
MSVSRVLAKVKEEDWNLSTFLGELPETMQYFAAVARGITKSYSAVKRGDVRTLHGMMFPRWNRHVRVDKGRGQVSYPGGSGRRIHEERLNIDPRYGRGSALTDVSGGKWMEWRYAISPMMYDLDDALKYLYSSSLRPLIRHAKASGKLFSEDWIRNPTTGDTHHWSKVRVDTGVYYTATPYVDAFKRLGLLNPVATLYELTPLSFVLDWFLPIGTYLGNLDAMAGVTVFGSYQTERTYLLSESFTKTYPPLPYGETRTPNTWTRKIYARAANPSLSIPLPKLQIGLNAQRFLDGLVLLRQFAK